MGPYTALKPEFVSVPRFVIEWLENLQRYNRVSMGNQPNVSNFSDQAFSELRSSFPIIPKDLAKWKYFTHWKNLIFSENQFWSFCGTILMKMYVFFRNRWAESEIVSQKDQNWFSENHNFPMCKIHSFCQIFWNYGKSRSELLARWYRKFWSIWLIYYWNPIVALQVFETFYDKLGYRTKFWFGSCIGSHNFQKTFLGSNVIVF